MDQIDTSGNGAFASGGSALQLALDSTSLGALKQCPRLYELSIIRGWAPRRMSVDLQFGIWLHEGREGYYRKRALGAEHEPAMLETIKEMLVRTFDAEIGRPWISEDSNKNRLTLIRTLCWYLDKWSSDPMETIMLANGAPAVELSFKFETDYSTPDGTPFLLCGHLDRLVTLGTETYISDLKSTKHTLDPNYVSQFSPDNQMSLYTLGAKTVYSLPVKGIIIDAAQVAVTFSRFQRFPVLRTDDQLTEWYTGLGVLIEQAQEYARAGFWPMNEKACFRCSFRPICAKPPGARLEWLKTDYVKRVWDPTKARGDI